MHGPAENKSCRRPVFVKSRAAKGPIPSFFFVQQKPYLAKIRAIGFFQKKKKKLLHEACVRAANAMPCSEMCGGQNLQRKESGLGVSFKRLAQTGRKAVLRHTKYGILKES